ncbi:hypothetical protein ACQP2F_25325 [Actinoplanes sp. CA-030573]|uniref:hypothetical protein n=1 Tax=Actinoplanes sp. CA-030573 TaxID=3239898 RepID=UPI003D8DA9DD
MARFADKDDLLVRLTRELREQDRRLIFLIGPDLAGADGGWPGSLVRVAGEYVQLRQNDDLRRELRRVSDTATDPAALHAGYRKAFDDWLGPEEFDVVVQRMVLERYRPPDDERLPDPIPARPLDFDSARILELAAGSWRIAPGLLALGRIAAAFPDQLDHLVLAATPEPGIEVALGRAGLIANPITPFSHPSLTRSTRPGEIDVLHLLGYWRPLDRRQRTAPLPDLRDPRLPRDAADRLTELLAGKTICVLGYRGGDPIVTAVLQAAVAEGAHVLWGVREDADRDSRIRGLAARIGGGANVVVHSSVDGDVLLQKLAVRFALIPAGQGPPPLPRVPVPRLFEQLEMARGLGSVPLRTPADGATDLLRQLGERFDWRLERPAHPAPALLFWPVRLRPPSIIHMVQALAAAALSSHGVRVVLALDDIGNQPPTVRADFEERVGEWFARIPEAQSPDVISLRSWIEEQEQRPPRLRSRPTRPWAVLQEYYGQHKPSAYETLRAAKIVPDIEPDEESAALILESLKTRGAQRLLTAPAVWSLFNDLLLGWQPSEVMTLAGEDERPLWRHRHTVTGEPTRHLYHPRIVNLSQDSGLIRWDHYSDLHAYIDRAVGQENWRRENRYMPWLVRHAFLLPEYLRTGGGARLGDRTFNAWQDVLGELQTTPGLADLLARRMSSWFLGEQD